KPYAMNEKEREEALALLKSENLLFKTNDLLGKCGIVGEEKNRQRMLIILTTRKREIPLHIISLGASGTGKTYLQEKVSELIPEEDKIEITSLSENAFYYFDKQELKNKLVLFEDLDGALTALFPLRELQSKRKITKRISIKDNKGNTKTICVTVEGPICVAGCTTKESIYEDNANRSFLIYLDETKQQDERIMERQRLLSAGKINIEEEQRIKKLLQNCQRLLQPVTIKNPFAEYLKLPDEVFKPRRTNNHYLQFIEAITFYKQYQREQKTDEATGEIYIEATLEDIEEANELMKEILLRKSDELNKACRTYFEYLKAYLKAENKTAFTAKEVRQALKTNHSNQKRYMLTLLENNYIRKIKTKENNFAYEIPSYEEYEKLKASISNILDDILNKLKENKNFLSAKIKVNSSDQVHKQNEPLNESKMSNLNTEVQKFTKRHKRGEKKVMVNNE
ncbi:MAG: hypothetical protein PHH82_04955, partial [Candidatus ainarchaeum sp.]|nr:hypothetical protein [Candidatus ainarchaeum sp.]